MRLGVKHEFKSVVIFFLHHVFFVGCLKFCYLPIGSNFYFPEVCIESGKINLKFWQSLHGDSKAPSRNNKIGKEYKHILAKEGYGTESNDVLFSRFVCCNSNYLMPKNKIICLFIGTIFIVWRRNFLILK